MNRPKLVLQLLIVFLLGGIAGAAVSLKWVDRRAQAAVEGEGPGIPHIVARRLTRELNLDATQRIALQKELERVRHEIAALQQPLRPEIEKILQDARGRIRSQLKPAQVERFDRMTERAKGAWQRRLSEP